MADTRIDVLSRVEGVPDAEERCGLWHQLHEPTRALSRHGAMIESRFRPDDRPDEALRHRVSGGRLGDLPSVGPVIDPRRPPRRARRDRRDRHPRGGIGPGARDPVWDSPLVHLRADRHRRRDSGRDREEDQRARTEAVHRQDYRANLIPEQDFQKYQ